MSTDAPKDEEFATLRGLLGALGYAADNDHQVVSDIEDYADGYMEEDLGMNLFVNLGEGNEGECVSLRAKMSFYTDDAVNMWTLEVPVTVSQFHRYLDVLDLRVARLRAIVELPTSAEATDVDDEDEVSIVEVLSRFFGSDEAEVVDQLGDNWAPVVSDDMGYASSPVRYLLWSDRLIIGLDDEYGHLFRPILTKDEVGVGDVITFFELGEDETIGLAEFAHAVHSALETG